MLWKFRRKEVRTGLGTLAGRMFILSEPLFKAHPMLNGNL